MSFWMNDKKGHWMTPRSTDIAFQVAVLLLVGIALASAIF